MKSEVVVKTKFFVIKAADWLGQARTNETDNHHTSKRGTSHSFFKGKLLTVCSAKALSSWCG